jgi:hypothetical protein
MPDEPAAVVPFKSPERIEHDRRMASGDREYVETFLRNSVKKGKRFSIVVVCEDEFESRRLFESIRAASQPRKINEPARDLVAGCQVTAIFNGDVSDLLKKVKEKTSEVVTLLGG